MADYQLTDSDLIIRTADQAWIPDDPGNRDRAEYDKWLAAGGVPDPAGEIAPPVAGPAPTEETLYDHENRIRTLEGEPPLTWDEFTKGS